LLRKLAEKPILILHRYQFMVRLLVITLVMQLSALTAVWSHDIHVSVTEVKEDADGELQISVRIFQDDLMNACGLTPGEELPEGYTSSDDLIEQYVKQHLQVTIDGEKQVLTYKESNPGQMSVWIDLSIKNDMITETSRIHIENTILLDLFDDQTNLLHYNKDGQRDSFTFNKKVQEKIIN